MNDFSQISRIVFPLSFFTLNAFYWYTYLKHSERIELQIEAAWVNCQMLELFEDEKLDLFKTYKANHNLDKWNNKFLHSENN